MKGGEKLKLLKLQCKLLSAVKTAMDSAKKSLNKGLCGSANFEQMIIIIIVIVIGLLVLGALYMMFKDTLIPQVEERLLDLFDFAG